MLLLLPVLPFLCHRHELRIHLAVISLCVAWNNRIPSSLGSQSCSDTSGGCYYNNVFHKADALTKASSTLPLQAVLPDEMPDILVMPIRRQPN